MRKGLGAAFLILSRGWCGLSPNYTTGERMEPFLDIPDFFAKSLDKWYTEDEFIGLR
jgi:hypothetical protein